MTTMLIFFVFLQVIRAIIASTVSMLFTLVVTVLAFTKIHEMEAGTNNLVIPVRTSSFTLFTAMAIVVPQRTVGHLGN